MAGAPGGANLDIVFRPVRAEDKARILDFTAKTWDDGDYIGEVFDDWLADAGGRFTAAEVDGQVMAIAKLTDLGEGELWLEGLRVDPEQRRRGLGAALHDHQMELARGWGARVLRYATGESNAASRRLGERTGFRLISSWIWHAAEPSADAAPPERLIDSDRARLLAWLQSPLLRSAGGLYPRMWKWAALSPARLERHLRAGEVWGLRGDGDLLAWSICERVERWDELLLQHLDGRDVASMADLVRRIRRLAADAGRTRVEGFALDGSPPAQALRQAGYAGEDFRMVVLELDLPVEN